MSQNVARLLTDAAAAHKDRPAYKLDDVVLPWSAVDEASARIAGLLRAKGLAPGDRVGIMLPNVPYFPIAARGPARAGAAHAARRRSRHLRPPVKEELACGA